MDDLQTGTVTLSRWLSYFTVEGACLELRALRLKSDSRRPVNWAGYFDNAKDAAVAVANGNHKNFEGTYITLNPLVYDVIDRRRNRFEYCDEKYVGASKSDVVCRRWLYVDIDATRPVGVSANQAELQSAINLGMKIKADLDARGLRVSFVNNSGNGIHLLVRIDLPADDGGLVRNCLRALDAKYSNAVAKVDTSVHDAPRIIKAPGSMVRKGDHSEQRPHRFSRMIEQTLIANWNVAVDNAALEALAREAPPEKSATVPVGSPPGSSSGAALKAEANDAQVRGYILKVPRAVSGQKGHAATYHAACVLVQGFNLTPEQAAPYFIEWNDGCSPPWDEYELTRKLHEADRASGSRGHLINSGLKHQATIYADLELDADLADWDATTGHSSPAPGPANTPPGSSPPPAAGPGIPVSREEDDPTAIADQIAQQHSLTRPGGSETYRTLIRWAGLWYRWDHTSYVPVSDEDFSSMTWKSIETLLVSNYQRRARNPAPNTPPPKVKKINTNLVAAVVGSMKANYRMQGGPIVPRWLNPDLTTASADKYPDAKQCIALNNGILHVAFPPVLLPKTPAFFTLSSTSCNFDPLARCPNWLKFIDEVFGEDDEAKECLQQYMGLLLITDMSYQKLLFLVGKSRAGKGTIIRVMHKLYGEKNVCTPSFDDLAGRFGLQALVGKTVALMGDVKVGNRADVEAGIEKLVSISGGDARDIDRKGVEILAGYRLSVRFVMACNELPRFNDPSGVIAGRSIVLNFEQNFYGREDRDLDDKLEAELPGILNWAIEGLANLRAKGSITQPQSGREILLDFRELVAPIMSFINDECVRDKAVVSDIDALFHVYKKWCEANGYKPFAKNAFGRALISASQSDGDLAIRCIRQTVGGKKVRRYAHIGLRPYETTADGKTELQQQDLDF